MGGHWRTISVALQANAAGYVGGMRAASTATRQFGASAAAETKKASAGADKAAASGTRMGSAWQTAGKVMAAGLVVIAVALGAVVGAAAQFDTRMRNVQSLTRQTDAEIRQVGDSLLDMSRVLPQSANTLAEGYYDAIGSGFETVSEALYITEQAAIAASAGLTTTEVAAKGILATLNAYGLEASAAADVSDVLFATVDKGVISFEELASNLGDFVGTAAAAGVPIDDAAAALATMTLSGISAAEASTSLNRVLQSLIDPSDEMATVLGQLGLGLDDLADPAIGLEGVMDRLRTATGGQVETLMRLFPEIRAARGALALMANDGANYTRVSAQVADADERQGATKAALAEQSKAFAFQLEIVKNNIGALAIEAGTHMLPVLTDMLSAGMDLGRSIGGWASDLWDRAQPAIRAVVDAGADLVSMLAAAWEGLQPLITVGGGILLGGLLLGLQATAEAVSDLSGFLEDHREIVVGAAVAWGTLQAAMLLNRGGSAATTALLAVAGHAESAWVAVRNLARVVHIQWATGGIRGVATALSGVATAGVSASIATAGVLAGVAGGVAYAQNVLDRSQEHAEQWAENMVKALNIDEASVAGRLAGVQAIQDEIDALGDEPSGWTHRATQIYQNFNPFVDNDIEERGRKRAEADRLANQQLDAARNMIANQKLLAGATGLTTHQVERLAKAMGIDLTGGIQESSEARDELIKSLPKLAETAQVTGHTLEEALQLDPDVIQAQFEEIDAVMKTVAGKWGSFFDVLQLRHEPVDPDAVRRAEDTIREAEGRLAEAREGGEARSIEAARRHLDEVRKARDELVASDAPLNADKIAGFYETRLTEAATFQENLKSAIADGYDPNLISRLIQAGPEQAGPLLQALVDASTAAFVDQVNAAEAAMAEMSASAVEMARITQLAIQRGSSEMSKQVSTALAIAQQVMDGEGLVTVSEVAKRLGLPESVVAQVAKNYQIMLADLGSFGAAEREQAVAIRTDQMRTDVRALALVMQKEISAAPLNWTAFLDVLDVEGKVQLVDSLLIEYAESNPTAKAILDVSDPKTRLDLIMQALEAYDATKADATVVLDGDKAVEDRIDEITRDRTIRISLDVGAAVAAGQMSLAAAEHAIGARPTPGRAAGGRVQAGRAYIVGERRPEVFVSDHDGTIVPSTDRWMPSTQMVPAAQMVTPPRQLVGAGVGGRGAPSITNNVTTNGLDAETVAAKVSRKTNDDLMGW